MWVRLCAFVVLVTAFPGVDTVDYKLIELDSPIIDIAYCGPEQDVILVRTQKHSVYRSETSGFSWKQLKDILMREGRAHAGDSRSIGQVVSMQVSPADKRLLVMLGNKGINWFSNDCGESIWALNYGKPIYEFQFHPIEPDWGLAASWTVCSDPVKDTCELYKELYVTKDLGSTWLLVTSYVLQFSWAQDSLDPYLQRRLPSDRIYVTYIPNASGHQSTEEWTHKAEFVKSDDYFVTTSTLVQRGNKFIISEKYILVAQVAEQDSTEVQILVSNERNIEQFYKVDLPAKHISDHSFTLIDSSEESIFLHVNPLSGQSGFGHVYVSDASGRRFSVSLLRNSQTDDGSSDFDKVYGLEGIYIANVVAPSIDFTQKTGPKSQRKGHKEKDIAEIRTLVTFDKGSIWRPLQAPERDSKGKRIVCEDEPCSLHLHSFSSKQFAAVYSNENSVGLVLGSGNVGPFLSSRIDEVNTYLSRDGGLTWFEVRKGSYLYEIGDHGALIVLVDNHAATDTLYFSWNEGLSWESLQFTDDPIEVENIVIEPGAVSQRFVLMGSRGRKGVAVGLDFSSLKAPQCRSPDQPGTEESDYEIWSPNDNRAGSVCLMGRTVSYVRKKREAECYNGEQFERSAYKESCECTDDDYECDIGYFREGSAPCSRIPNFDLPSEMCVPGDEFYEIPTGYRRIAGDTCVRGVSLKYDPMKIPCNATIFSSRAYALFMVLLAVVMILLMSWQAQRLQELWVKLTESRGTVRYTKGLPDDDV